MEAEATDVLRIIEKNYEPCLSAWSSPRECCESSEIFQVKKVENMESKHRGLAQGKININKNVEG